MLHSFTGGNDGSPLAGLIFGKNGALYGTTPGGGAPSNGGTVFQLTPPAKGQTQWTETVLHRFGGGYDGAEPRAGLIFGEFGALNGTTSSGGTLSGGTVFKLRPPAAGQTAWRETVLHNFGATGDGADPVAGLIFGKNGALYGTTESGGASRNGTVFQLQ